MTDQRKCFYGLKSIIECMSRAAFLSHPDDIINFMQQYISELSCYRTTQTEIDPKKVFFNYQHMWEQRFLSMNADTGKLQHLPAEVDEKQTTLFLELASSPKGSKNKNPSATPSYTTPAPPCVGQYPKKNVLPPFLVVKGEGMPTPPPANVSAKNRRVSRLKLPGQGTADEVEKTAKTCQVPREMQRDETADETINPRPRWNVLPSIPIKSTPKNEASTPSDTSKPPKPPGTLVPIMTHKLVLPPILHKDTRGGTIPGNDVSRKRQNESPMNKDKVADTSSSRSQAQEAKGKSGIVSSTGGKKGQRGAGTERNKRKPKTPNVVELEMKWTQPRESLESTRENRVLWTDREKVRPISGGKVRGIQGTAFTSGQASANPNLPPIIDGNQVLRYRRMHLRASYLD